MKKQIHVVTLGPSLTEQGGMGSVAKLLVASGTEDFKFTHISTWNSHLKKPSLILHFAQCCFSYCILLLRNKADIVHLHISEGGSLVRTFILSLIAWLFGKPVILHAHGSEFHDFYTNLPKLGKRWINVYISHCDILIALSESWRQFYINTCQLDPNKVIVLKNPVALPSPIPERHHYQQIKFLFMGKINQRKGAYDLVNALAQLKPEVRAKITFILAGSGEVEAVRCLAKQVGVLDYLNFPGWVDSETRDRLLHEADVFVLPSYNEGLPMALLEAMAWALPSITTPVGGIPEVIISDTNGILVQPGDIEALALAISNLTMQDDLRIRLGIQARNKVMELDINCYREKMLTLYGGLLA